ncbi:hypothetical protein D0B88_14135 [Cellvibrio sp. KY-YJ-3]|nr:hypothetical protein D0B88_14135 [Cellvibrio sp. KY-YJ-3]
MNQQIKIFAEERGLSQSAAARLLIDRGLSKNSDDISNQIDNLSRVSSAILHASVVARIMASEAAKQSGSDLSGDELKSRADKMLLRYQHQERVSL